MIEINNLTKRFGYKTVLDEVDFRVEQGECVALLGPNGAGKTTFLRIIASLTRSTSGSVRVAGYLFPQEAAEVRRRLGVVLHQPLLYGDLNAEENLRFYGRMYGVPDMEKRIRRILELTGLIAYRSDLVRTYSRGMRQRLAIGRSVLHSPEILLLDEPYTGLDQNACEMLNSILEQEMQNGSTVVMTSHDLKSIASLASRFDLIDRGAIKASIRHQDLPPGELAAFYQQALRSTELISTAVQDIQWRQ